ncbi:phosphonate C-P lyase system protein PhnG [Bacillus sp. PS06]|uniref:phosphonate C-P lyase system protein PhnG n=1 Tax=Bacillus sp. PS06 TaxID=2764176 RepID=UPI001780BF6C|nr:phosphonate C-P lyase system protein PhnG [Bacillus sp. PS06]MBD8067906.1 phosphonate C-P lyase system protein PhnG [Bacillus sp. PS06]
MKKSRLTKILVEGDPALLKKLSTQVEGRSHVQLERPASCGLVMIKARDSVSMQPFYMGEVLLSECTVAINDSFGIGVIMGEALEKAYQLAVIDAAFNAQLDITSSWKFELEEEERNIYNKQLMESKIVSQSQVHFDTMEDYNDKS